MGSGGPGLPALQSVKRDIQFSTDRGRQPSRRICSCPKLRDSKPLNRSQQARRICLKQKHLKTDDFAKRRNLPWAQGVGRSNRPAPTNVKKSFTCNAGFSTAKRSAGSTRARCRRPLATVVHGRFISCGIRLQCNATLPIGEIGGSRAQGHGSGRGITQAAQAGTFQARKPGETWSTAKLYPCATRGAAPPREPSRPVSEKVVESKDCYSFRRDLPHFQREVS